MYVGQCGVPLEYLCPPRYKPLDQQKKKKCFSSQKKGASSTKPNSLHQDRLFGSRLSVAARHP